MDRQDEQDKEQKLLRLNPRFFILSILSIHVNTAFHALLHMADE